MLQDPLTEVDLACSVQLMVEYIISLSSKGQIVIPQMLRALLGLRPHQKLKLQFINDTIVISRPETIVKIPKRGRPTSEERMKKNFARLTLRRVRNVLDEKDLNV